MTSYTGSTGLTIDANVWVAAADKSDPVWSISRDFLADIVRRRMHIYLPSYARVEIACALARRRRDAGVGLRLTEAMFSLPFIIQVPTDSALLVQALMIGTEYLLRGADALYAATAEQTQTKLVSWDGELITRAGAITPTTWASMNA